MKTSELTSTNDLPSTEVEAAATVRRRTPRLRVAVAALLSALLFAGLAASPADAYSEIEYWHGFSDNNVGHTTGLYAIEGGRAWTQQDGTPSAHIATRIYTLDRYYATYASATSGGYAELFHARKIYHRSSCNHAFYFGAGSGGVLTCWRFS